MAHARPLAPTFDPTRWVPPPERAHRYRISAFMREIGCDDLRALYERAAQDPEWFYPAVLDFLGAGWMQPWERVLDLRDGQSHPHWFVGARTNVAWLASGRWRDTPGTALAWEGDDGSVRELSHRELDDAVVRAAAGLRANGVGRGDVVGVYMPSVPEAVVAILAIARIGAIFMPVFSGFGVDPLTERLTLGGAKMIVTADGCLRRGRRVELLGTAIAAADRVASVRRIVVVPRLGDPLPADPRVVPWEALNAHGEDGPIEAFDVEMAWLLIFTSGSTGRPKGAVHVHGGFPYGLMIELGFSLDVGPGDRFCWPADLGWLTGPLATVGPLALGAATVLFEGVMDHPAPDRYWKIIERHGVTTFGLAPTAVRMLAAAGAHWTEPFTLPSLRIVACSGEPLPVAAWQWLHQNIGRGHVPVINWSGGTEVGGCIVAGMPNATMLPARFAGPQLGMAADVVDPQGRPLVGEPGELVVRRGWLSMTRSLWREPERYFESYWSKIPGLWVQGDRAIRHADGTFEIPGRSDDVMKIAGKRIGPVELESIACEVDGVVSAAAVGIEHETKGMVPVIAVVTAAGRGAHAEIAEAVISQVVERFGKPVRPQAVLVLPDLPRTRNGKIHRRALRAWIQGVDPGDVSTLENPEVEQAVKNALRPGPA
ncbi:MAG: AMP-binding protein [Gammaproteobacteria bacterium]